MCSNDAQFDTRGLRCGVICRSFYSFLRTAWGIRRARRGGVKDSEKVATELTHGFIGDIAEYCIHYGKV